MKNCKLGNHNLEVIQRRNLGYDEIHVVRWCSNCGAVVIDGEYDGRTFPGKIMALKQPSCVKE